MTIEQLIEAVKGNIARTDKDSVITQAIGWALRRLCSDYDLPELDSTLETQTVAGRDWVALPSDMRVLWNLWCGDRLLKEHTLVSLARMYPDRSVVLKGKPWLFVRSGMDATSGNVPTVRLWPVPDAAYVVRFEYSRWPKVPTTGELEVQEWDDALIAAATAEVYLHLQQYNDASAWLSTYRRVADITSSNLTRRPHMRFGSGPGRYVSPNPQADPFVKGV